MLIQDNDFIYKYMLAENIDAPVHISDLNIDGYTIKEIFRKNKYNYEPIEVGVCLNCLLDTVLKDINMNSPQLLRNKVKEWIDEK